MTGPRRRATDHIHDEYWKETDQHRYEDQTRAEREAIRRELKRINDRMTMLLGAIALIVFIVPIIAPFIRSFLAIP